jgi:hypothetical protein
MLFATKVLSHLHVKVSPYHKWNITSGNTVVFFCEDFENFYDKHPQRNGGSCLYRLLDFDRVNVLQSLSDVT